ncbi:MAG: sarcosine oxidase subunit gamma [Rhodobacteraceae bacterium]|nr:sarcosine oxidase subunit gamma [Paracoccaceae bacterium]
MLKPLTALGHEAPETVQIGTLRIIERFDVALASLAQRRGQEAAFAKASAGLGLPLPGPARAEAGPVLAAFWVAPEMWLVEAPFASHEDIVAALKPVFGESASLTEQTDAWVRFDLSAPDLAPLLARLTNIDWPQAPVGYASRTVIEHLGVYLIRRAEGMATLYGPRSSAASLLHALEVTARSL